MYSWLFLAYKQATHVVSHQIGFYDSWNIFFYDSYFTYIARKWELVPCIVDQGWVKLHKIFIGVTQSVEIIHP